MARTSLGQIFIKNLQRSRRKGKKCHWMPLAMNNVNTCTSVKPMNWSFFRQNLGLLQYVLNTLIRCTCVIIGLYWKRTSTSFRTEFRQLFQIRTPKTNGNKSNTTKYTYTPKTGDENTGYETTKPVSHRHSAGSVSSRSIEQSLVILLINYDNQNQLVHWQIITDNSMFFFSPAVPAH